MSTYWALNVRYGQNQYEVVSRDIVVGARDKASGEAYIFTGQKARAIQDLFSVFVEGSGSEMPHKATILALSSAPQLKALPAPNARIRLSPAIYQQIKEWAIQERKNRQTRNQKLDQTKIEKSTCSLQDSNLAPMARKSLREIRLENALKRKAVEDLKIDFLHLIQRVFPIDYKRHKDPDYDMMGACRKRIDSLLNPEKLAITYSLFKAQFMEKTSLSEKEVYDYFHNNLVPEHVKECKKWKPKLTSITDGELLRMDVRDSELVGQGLLMKKI
jgi:hypothetical protein